MLMVFAGAAVAQTGSRWALDPDSCDGEADTRPRTPLIVEAMSVRWFNADCKVVSSYKVKDTWFLQGQCMVEGRTGTIPIMLEPSGNHLRVGWNREPIQEMQRCQWPPAM
jgi:hypothetical protein